MSGQIDAFGNLATAALAAREFDRGSLHDPGAPGLCANCEEPVDGRFCANCGQPAHVHRSVLHVAEELLHGLTHFDGKAWKTLPLLLFRPGKLTHDYVHGKRARYVPPVALFLLTVFVMFFAFSFVKGPDDLVLDGKGVIGTTPAQHAEAARNADTAVADIKAKLAKAEADPNAKPGQTGVLSGALAAAEAVQTQAHEAVARDKATQGVPPTSSPGKQPTAATAAKPKSVDGKPLFQADEDKPIMSVSAGLDELRKADQRGDLGINFGSPQLNERARHALANPELTVFKVQQKAYKFSFLLVPLSLPVLWLMFVFRRHVYLYDHTVFALYSLSFMSLVVIAASTMFALGYRGALFAPLLLLVPPLHMYAQLKGAYQLTVFGAAWRAVVLATAAVITLAFFAVLIAVLGVVD